MPSLCRVWEKKKGGSYGDCVSHHNEVYQDSGNQMVTGGWKECDLGIDAYDGFDG